MKKSPLLLQTALALYCKEHNVSFPEETFGQNWKAEVLRNEYGKPYFKQIPLQFSISHSEKTWVCLMGEQPVGIDIQRMRAVDEVKIAGRFFRPEEMEYIQKHGQIGFFDIWRRKEAYVKYVGMGMSMGFSGFSVIKQGQLSEQIQDVWVWDVLLKNDIICTICAREKEEIWIRTME